MDLIHPDHYRPGLDSGVVCNRIQTKCEAQLWLACVHHSFTWFQGVPETADANWHQSNTYSDILDPQMVSEAISENQMKIKFQNCSCGNVHANTRIWVQVPVSQTNAILLPPGLHIITFKPLSYCHYLCTNGLMWVIIITPITFYKLLIANTMDAKWYWTST